MTSSNAVVEVCEAEASTVKVREAAVVNIRANAAISIREEAVISIREATVMGIVVRDKAQEGVMFMVPDAAAVSKVLVARADAVASTAAVAIVRVAVQ
jgi:hypothetical protein